MICLSVGLLLSIVYATRRLGVLVDGAAYALVTSVYAVLAVVTFGYVALFALLLSGGGRRVNRVLSPAGRMALTCYLASILIGAFVTYGWAFGMLGRMNGAALNSLAIAPYAGLCGLFVGWLRRFRFGPAEWRWRSQSYGRWQPMMRRRSPAGPRNH